MNREQVDIFISACFEGLEKASELLDKNPNLIYERTGLGETPLHYLVVENQLEAVKFLYSKGADLNTISEVSGTPISEAASLGYFDMVKFLLENGANIRQLPDSDPIIFDAVRSGKPEIVDLLAKHGADLNAKNFLSQTPLHESASEDKLIKVTKYLVKQGLNINALDGFHSSPLHESSIHGCLETAKFLVASGSLLTIKDSKGRTPAEMAQQCNHYDLAKWLIEAEKTQTP